MCALFQDILADWPSVVIQDSDLEQVEQFAVEVLCVRHSVAAEKPSVEENSEGRWIVEGLKTVCHVL
jgi:hypothetical protein